MSLTLQPEPYWMTMGDLVDDQYDDDEFDDYDEDDDFLI